MKDVWFFCTHCCNVVCGAVISIKHLFITKKTIYTYECPDCKKQTNTEYKM